MNGGVVYLHGSATEFKQKISGQFGIGAGVEATSVSNPVATLPIIMTKGTVVLALARAM
jgi:hypothetical protein